ncbi:hypothetical protein Q7C36_001203 [Tachysurus vachellii]|uniref:Uncharacterized protein n=1 Tax=Tachysurus vachellii TaxID=175792 RepID=A0AA88NXE7_TACVA|nr:hypothetical protein Q7C36_001203 [Tachysurus vachellii]
MAPLERLSNGFSTVHCVRNSTHSNCTTLPGTTIQSFLSQGSNQRTDPKLAVCVGSSSIPQSVHTELLI